MISWHDPALFLVALFAGVLNSIAGGGSFFTFPTLLWAGLNPIIANATNTLALFPGSFISAWAYRHDMTLAQQKLPVIRLALISVAGGILGSVLLLSTPEHLFMHAVPWLLSFASLIFIFGNRITAWSLRHFHLSIPGIFFLQFLISIYGGYFGGGVGILMLAVLSLYGLEDFHSMNGLKTLLAGCMNLMATLTFVVSGHIDWHTGGLMMISATLGGWLGPAIAKKIPQTTLRQLVACVAVATSIYFFLTT